MPAADVEACVRALRADLGVRRLARAPRRPARARRARPRLPAARGAAAAGRARVRRRLNEQPQQPVDLRRASPPRAAARPAPTPRPRPCARSARAQAAVAVQQLVGIAAGRGRAPRPGRRSRPSRSATPTCRRPPAGLGDQAPFALGDAPPRGPGGAQGGLDRVGCAHVRGATLHRQLSMGPPASAGGPVQDRKWALARFFCWRKGGEMSSIQTDIEARLAQREPDVEVLLAEVVGGDDAAPLHRPSRRRLARPLRARHPRARRGPRALRARGLLARAASAR